MKRLILSYLLFFPLLLKAQMPHDALYMPRKTACGALIGGLSSWDHYWENTLRRTNQNIGVHTTESLTAMATVGITDRFNATVVLPYMRTRTSSGNLLGQRGFQDVALWLKYRLVQQQGFSLHGVVGVATPASNYVPDFLPMSIGIGCKTLTTRGIAHYQHSSGWYSTAHASFNLRSNIQSDRDAYFAHDRLYYTSEVSVPNALDAGLRLGYMSEGQKLQLELFGEHFQCVEGDYIRPGLMPFPTNQMEMTQVGVYGKYQPHRLGVNLRAATILAGRNVGQQQMLSLGILYVVGKIQ